MKKRILHIFLFAAALALGVLAAAKLTVRKTEVGTLMQENTQADVLFFGTSHVNFGILPGELWAQNGITAYNCAVNGEPMRVTKWAIRSAVEQKRPKLIVLDVYSLSVWRDNVSAGAVHTSLDWAPLNQTKLEMTKDLLPKEDRMEVLFPFARYHARWEELTKEDFEGKQTLYGGTRGTGIAQYFAPAELLPQTEMLDEHGQPAEALREIAAYCRKENIPLVLTELPGPNAADQQRYINAAAQVAKEYDLPYYDMDRMEIVRKETDYNDISMAESGEMGYHLNVSGAGKVTRWLGNVLQSKYALPDHRGESGYEAWAEKYDAYHQQLAAEIASETNLYTLLLRLTDPGFSAAVVIPQQSNLIHDANAMALLQNLGLAPDTERLAQDCYMGVSDTDTASVQEMWNSGEYSWYNVNGSAVCKVGFERCYQGEPYSNPSVIAGGEDRSHRVYNDLDRQPDKIDVQIVVVDNRSKTVIAAPAFSLSSTLWSYRKS